MAQKYIILFLFFLSVCLHIFPEGLWTGQVDSAVNWGNERIYFQKGDQYIRFNLSSNKVDSGYPKNISPQTWRGVPFPRIEGAVDFGNGKVYLFYGSEYVRYDKKKNEADPGYPKPVNDITWPGLGFSSVDAAFNSGAGKVYFFKGNQYVRYDIGSDKADPGYPKPINKETWPGLGFSSIDAATVINSKVFLFSGEEYVRFDLDLNRADEGYPKNIMENWQGLRFPYIPQEEGEYPVPGPGDSEWEELLEEEEVSGKVGFEVSRFEIDLSPYKINEPTTVLGRAIMAVYPNGNMWIGFQVKSDLHLIPLDSNFKSRGNVVILKNYIYSCLMAMEDGTLMVLAGKDVNNTYIPGYANTIYLIKLDSKGREIFNTQIFGGTGHGPGKSWFDGRSKGRMTYNGSEFGIYFEVQKNWAEPGEADDIHNGDMFAEVSSKGKLLEDRTHFWTASHSSTVQVTTGGDGKFYTTTIGDAYPYGLQFYNRDVGEEFILWPPKEDYITYEEVNSTNAAGILEQFAPVDKEFFVLMGTLEHPNIGVFDKVDVLFLRFDNKGKIVTKKWLSQTPAEDESVIAMARTGGHYLLGWGKGNDYDEDWEPGKATLSVINGKGDLLLGPEIVNYPLGSYSEFYSLPGDKVMWIYADNGASKVEVFVAEAHY